MDKYLMKGVKDVIAEFPEVGTVLDRFGIGCVTCSVGTCLLKDIIDIHNLPRQQEIEMMAEVEKIIYPERNVVTPEFMNINGDFSVRAIKYSSPIKKLVDEHSLIKAFLSCVPKLIEAVGKPDEIDKTMILKSVDFIRSYADRFHHAKEEDILFKYIDADSDIIKAMLEDHQTARGYVKAVLAGLEEQNGAMIAENLNNYSVLLQQHIKREDEILYPWIERSMSVKEIDEMYELFEDIDRSVGKSFTYKWLTFINQLDHL